MIKAIFCHELPIYKDINGVYCSNTMTNAFFEKYFVICDELVVVTRVYEIDKPYTATHFEKVDLPNVRFVDIPNINDIKKFLRIYRETTKIITKEMNDSQFAFIRGGIIAAIGAKVARKLSKPYLMEVGGDVFAAYWHHSFAGKLLAPIMELITKRDVKKAQGAVYVTQEWLQNKYPTNGLSYPISDVQIDEINENYLINRLQKIQNTNMDELVFGTTAGISVPYKGQRFMIRCLPKQGCEHYRYELVGGGDPTAIKQVAKKENVEDRVVIHGPRTHSEVLDFATKIDVYIQPSQQEGLPRSIVEAMSRACPVIGSRLAGIPELIPDQYLFNAGDVNDIYRVIRSLTKNDLLKMAKENFEKSKSFLAKDLKNKKDKAFLEFYDLCVRGLYESNNS